MNLCLRDLLGVDTCINDNVIYNDTWKEREVFEESVCVTSTL